MKINSMKEPENNLKEVLNENGFDLNNQDMRERFDDLFYEEINSFMGTVFGDKMLDYAIKDFIESEINLALQEQQEELNYIKKEFNELSERYNKQQEKIIKKIEDVISTHKYWNDDYNAGLRNTKADIISLIKESNIE